MKIADSNLQMSSTHAAVERRERRESLRYWEDGTPGRSVETVPSGREMRRLVAELQAERSVASVEISPPKRLRDLLWTPAIVQTGPAFKGLELGQVLLPAISPLSWQYDDTDVRLGRVTEWVALDDGTEVPVGQKLLLVDGEELPILELRTLEISAANG